MIQDVNDPRVSSVYRETATETAPDALNQSVLRQAREQATPRNLYSRSIFWLRPMAWAATIGLCLAIVVDLSDLPRPEPGLMPLPAATDPASIAEQARAAPQAADAALEEARPDNNSLRDEIIVEGKLVEEILVEAEQDAAQDTEPMAQRARKSVDEEGRVTLSNVPQLEKTETPAPEPAADIAAFEMRDRDNADQAAALARRREGTNINGGASGFAVSSVPALESAIEMPCDAAARKTPQSWLACIEALETDGLDEVAAWQRDELHAAFPEFELP